MTLIEEAIISGFIGEAISRCTDISWTKIKEAAKNRKNKHQSIESQIYNVIVNVLNQITYNEFENDQDKIYHAAEKLLMGYKDDRYDQTEVVRSGLQILGESINTNKYMEFKTQLYQELSKDDYHELYRQIRLLQQDQESDKTSRIEHGVNEVKQDVMEIKHFVLNENGRTFPTIQNIKFQNNKKLDYIKIWNSSLFLHRDNKENPLTLADSFIMPDYQMLKSDKKMEFNKDDTFDKIIKKFVSFNETSTMLIIGVPGIGKSTITSWIANRYKEDDRLIILRFRDWKRIELERSLLDAICNTLNCEQEKLENKLLILDGFDEMKLLDKRNRILNIFYNEIKDFKNFKCVITSRPNYIDSTSFSNVFRLQTFDIHKIEIFYKKITGQNLMDVTKIAFNIDVLGIPVILYMAIMSNVPIEKNPSKPELYNHIFARNGGIFDKFYDGKTEYSNGAHILRDPDNVEKYLKFLREVGYKMYKKGDLTLERNEYVIPKLDFQGISVSILDFPIKYLFEGIETDNIEFVHNSIYEYFVSEYFYYFICDLVKKSESTEELAGNLGKWLINRETLSLEIYEFLKYQVANKLQDEICFVKKAFQLMLEDGMTYHTGQLYRNVIKCETNIFVNMLEFLHLWEGDIKVKAHNFVNLIRYDREFGLNLINADLSEMDLRNVDLRNANLSGANLRNTDLSGANLSRANLSNADLEGTLLIGTNFTEAKLKNTYLVRANLLGAILKKADLSEANIIMVNIDRVNLSDSKLYGADLRGMDLRKVDLRNADLRKVNLSRANLTNVDFHNAKIEDILLDYANLTNAIFDKEQIMILQRRYNLKGTGIYVRSNKRIASYDVIR